MHPKNKLRVSVDPTATVSLHKDVQLRHYPQGHLVCAFGTNQAFEVDAIGALVLSNMEEPIRVAELIAKASEIFKKTSDDIGEDICVFIAECIELNILCLNHDR